MRRAVVRIVGGRRVVELNVNYGRYLGLEAGIWEPP